MIRDKLIPALLQKYSHADVRIGSPPDAIAVFPAQHPAVGELHIMDDGCEATVFVGEITHCHFNPYDSELS